MGITIIFGVPRVGKTCLMTFFLSQYMFDRQRNRSMQLELMQKQQSGFKSIKTIPQHCVSSNYNIIGKKFRYSPRVNRVINPYRLGFANKFVKTHFNLPYEVIGITEAQIYLDSHMVSLYPRWQSSWYEQHGHDYLDIFLDTQRPMLINANVRELASFIEVIKLTINTDKHGKFKSMTWKVRRIENSKLYDRYVATGGKDKECYVEEEITADYNVFECYDSRSCKPKFYEGHFDEDIDYQKMQLTEESLDGYLEYLKTHDEELPKEFYVKRGKSA